MDNLEIFYGSFFPFQILLFDSDLLEQNFDLVRQFTEIEDLFHSVKPRNVYLSDCGRAREVLG